MRVRILGAGIVGLACADELVRRGHDVVVHDPDPGRGASYAAAGMLSPSSEVWHGEEELLRLGLASLELWPELADRLGVELWDAGTLLVGYDAGDLQLVERQATLVERLGRTARPLDAREVRDREPGLARVTGGVLLPDDHSVDPRAVVASLLARLDGAVVSSAARPGDPTDCDLTVVATGAVLPEPFGALVRGVRGEILRLRSDDGPAATVRGWVRGEPVYLVPRSTGEVVVGATTEEHDAAPVVTAGGVLRLLATARALWPALDRAELVDAVARDRPGTPDNLPLVGPSGHAGVLLAAGHHRHGVLLAPLTARLVADCVEGHDPDPVLDPRRLTERSLR